MLRYFRNFFFQITGNPGIRFRKYDKPTEQSFSQLFDSVAFIKEKDDTSKLNEQGLVKIATDTNAINRDSTPDADQFTKTVLPHMLPNVLSGKNIVITNQNNASGRTGGTGKDFLVDNDMLISAAATVGNPIIVNQATPGDDAEIDFDQSILAPLFACLGKTLTDPADPTCDYFPNKIEIPLNNVVFPFLPHNRLLKNLNLLTHKLELAYSDKIGEISMYWAPNPAKYATDFVAGIGQGQWKYWVVCDGTAYNDSLGNPITTPDMRGTSPIGYGIAGANADGKNYTSIGSSTDGLGDSGKAEVTLTKGQIPKHSHELQNGVDGSTSSTSNPGDHTHNTSVYNASGSTCATVDPNLVGKCSDIGDSPVTSSGAGSHTHTLLGHTGDGTTDGLAGQAHENRHPFTTVVFVMYIG